MNGKNMEHVILGLLHKTIISLLLQEWQKIIIIMKLWGNLEYILMMIVN